MCILIDINVLCCVFSSTPAQHPDFLPVKKWVTSGPGTIVYGGSHYRGELRKTFKYFGIMTELNRQGRISRIHDGQVDAAQQIVEDMIDDPRCDDPHLIAIIRVSGCRLICSNDRRADRYLKDHRLYNNRNSVPKIFRNSSHRHLLNRRNIVALRSVVSGATA